MVYLFFYLSLILNGLIDIHNDYNLAIVFYQVKIDFFLSLCQLAHRVIILKFSWLFIHDI